MTEKQPDPQESGELFKTELTGNQQNVANHQVSDYFQGRTKDIDQTTLEAGKDATKNSEEDVERKIRETNVKIGRVFYPQSFLCPKTLFSQELISADRLITDFKVPDYETKQQKREYWNSLLTKQPESLIAKSQKYVEKVNRTYEQSISEKKILINKESRDADTVVAQMKLPAHEEEARRHQLKEYMRKKKELEEKLKELHTNIGGLQNESSPQPNPARKATSKERSPNPLDPPELVKKLAKERKENEERRLQKIKEREEKLYKWEEEERRRREEEKRERDEKRKQEILKEREEILRRNEKWKEDMKKWEQDWEKKVSSLPKLNVAGMNKVSEAEMEIHQQRIAEIKNMHKPMDVKVLLEFEKKYLEEHLAKEKQRKNEFKERAEREPIHFKKPDFESRFHKKFEEETKQLKEIEKERLQKAKEAMEKRWKYAETVKEQYFPPINEALRVELKQTIEKVPSRFQRSVSPPEKPEKSPRQLGNQYLAEVKQKVPKKPMSEITKSMTGAEQSEKMTSMSRHSEQNFKLKGLSKGEFQATQETTAKKKVDHMNEVRSKYELKKDVNEWQKIAVKQNIPEKDKRMLIKIQAERLEAAAKEKERVLRIMKGDAVSNDYQGGDDLDAMYIASIKAKLALLQDDPLEKQFEGMTPPKPVKPLAKKKKDVVVPLDHQPDNEDKEASPNQADQDSMKEPSRVAHQGSFKQTEPSKPANVSKQSEPSKPSLEPKASGTIMIYVIKAENIFDSESNNASDAYIALTYASKQIGKTKTQKNSLCPEWKEKFAIEITNQEKSKVPNVRFEIFIQDNLQANEPLGSTVLDIRECFEKPKQWGIMSVCPITGPQGQKTGGRLTVLVGFVPSGIEIKMPEPSYKVDGKFYINVVGADELKTQGKDAPEAYIKLMAPWKEIGKTKMMKSSNPEWKETFNFTYYSADSWVPPIQAMLFDQDTISSGAPIGIVDLDLQDAIQKPQTAIIIDGIEFRDPNNTNNSGDLGKLLVKIAYVPKGGAPFEFPK